MISQLKTMDVSIIDSLEKGHYARRIKSHFQAYGTQYDFARFYGIYDGAAAVGLICCFNSAMIICSVRDLTFSDDILAETAHFILMSKPASVELEHRYAPTLLALVGEDYSFDMRTEFQFVPRNILPQLDVNELPDLDDVFNVLRQSFPSIASSYELWLTDTSHRIRHGLSQSFLLGDYTTATIQYIIDKTALVGHVATIPSERGKFHARTLLYWIGERLTQDGFTVKLMARPHRVSYYEEIGFKEIGRDMVLERKENA